MGFVFEQPSLNVQRNQGSTVIDNFSMCWKRHNPRYFFARNRALSGDPPLETWSYYVDPPRETAGNLIEWKIFMNRMAYWGTVFDDMVQKGEDVSAYDHMAGEHLGRQPTIVEDLVETLKANVCRSFRALSKVFKPGLTTDNRVKQVAFTKHVHNR